MKISHIDLGEHPILLAPMEDVTDPAFRLMCKKFGADMVYTEFVSKRCTDTRCQQDCTETEYQR